MHGFRGVVTGTIMVLMLCGFSAPMCISVAAGVVTLAKDVVGVDTAVLANIAERKKALVPIKAICPEDGVDYVCPE